jgi:starvation-inducible DNA-binding protein
MTPLDKRTKWNALMNQRLAEAVDLQTQLKQASWNVRRTQTTSLHELFDEIAKEVECVMDMVAERIVQFGGIAKGTVRTAAVHSRLDEYPLAVGSGNHVEAVAKALTDFRRDASASIGEMSALGDRGSANLFSEICCGIDKWLWIIQARLKMTQHQLRNHGLTQVKTLRKNLVHHELIKPVKRSPASGFRFLTKFRQKNQTLRKEIVCQSSINSTLQMTHA